MQTAREEDVRCALESLADTELARVLAAPELEALNYGARQRVTDLHDESIRRLPSYLPGLFAAAARRARDANIASGCRSRCSGVFGVK